MWSVILELGLRECIDLRLGNRTHKGALRAREAEAFFNYTNVMDSIRPFL